MDTSRKFTFVRNKPWYLNGGITLEVAIAQAAASGYTLNDVIVAAKMVAKENYRGSSFPGYTDKQSLNATEMAKEIFGYVSYQDGYMDSGESWKTSEGPGEFLPWSKRVDSKQGKPPAPRKPWRNSSRDSNSAFPERH